MDTGDKKPTLTKEKIAAYVKDMAFLEEREFALRKAAEELRKQSLSMRESAEHQAERKTSEYRMYVNALEKWETAKRDLRDYWHCAPGPTPPEKPESYDAFKKEYVKDRCTIKEPPPKPKVGKAIMSTISASLMCCFFVAIGSFAIAPMVGLVILFMAGSDPEIAIPPLFAIIYGIIFTVSALVIFLICSTMNKKDYKRAMKVCEDYIRHKEEYIRYTEEFKQYQDQVKAHKEHVEKVEYHNGRLVDAKNRIEQYAPLVKNTAIEKARYEFLVDCAKDKEQIFIEQAEALEQKAIRSRRKRRSFIVLASFRPTTGPLAVL